MQFLRFLLEVGSICGAVALILWLSTEPWKGWKEQKRERLEAERRRKEETIEICRNLGQDPDDDVPL